MMTKGVPEVVAPPVATFTRAVPALARRLAGTAAATWVALTNVVVKAVPFHSTAASVPKPVPFTVSVNPGLPAAAVVGLIEVIVRGVAFATVSRKTADVLAAKLELPP